MYYMVNDVYHQISNIIMQQILDSVIVIGFNLVTMQCKTLELSYLKRDTSETNALQEPLLKWLFQLWFQMHISCGSKSANVC